MSINLRSAFMAVIMCTSIIFVGCEYATKYNTAEVNELRTQLEAKDKQIVELTNEAQEVMKSNYLMKQRLKKREIALTEAEIHVHGKTDPGDTTRSNYQLEQRLKEKEAYITNMKKQLRNNEIALAEAERRVSEQDGSSYTTASAIGKELLPPMAKPGECYARVFIPPTYNTVTEEVLASEESERLYIVPAKYEWVEERVLVKEESKRFEEVPAEYEWIEEQVLLREAYTEWKRGRGLVEKLDDVTGEIMCLIEVPATYKTVKKQVLVEPARVNEVVIPAEYKTVEVQKLIAPPQTRRVAIPAEYQTITRTVKVSEGKLEWKRVLCETNLSPEMVSGIQRSLLEAGHDPGPEDGVMGPLTHFAIESYQQENNLATGGLTYETIQSLGIEF